MGNKQNKFLLVEACQNQDIQTVEKLLSGEYDVNESTYIKREVPNYETFPLNFLVYDSIHYNPLRFAIEKSNLPILQLLVKKVKKKFLTFFQKGRRCSF
jgi:predicted nucleic acid-binding OB-fold protein